MRSVLMKLLSLVIFTKICRAQFVHREINMRHLPLVLLLSFYGGSSFAAEQSPAQKLFQRLVGIPASPKSPMLAKMQQLISEGKVIQAADLAMTDRHFYSIRARGFAAQMTNKEESPSEPFNDMQAMVLGAIRDDMDARLLLSGNFRYQGYSSLGLPPVMKDSNSHYLEFENRGYDHWKDLMRVNEQWGKTEPAAGVLTSRAWAAAHYAAGTNRRGFEYAMQIFMCVTKEQWKDRGLPDPYVRRDVDRNPGGNPNTYQTHCRNCHSIMDAMGGAFANVDFVNGAITFLGKDVSAKMNQNGEVWPEGYVTVDTSWQNFARFNHNEALGWRGPLSGNGLKEFGTMLANSQGFSECMVKRVFHDVCRRPLTKEDNAVIKDLAQKFEAGGYKFKSLFASVSTNNFCFDLSEEEYNAQWEKASGRSSSTADDSGAGCPYRP